MFLLKNETCAYNTTTHLPLVFSDFINLLKNKQHLNKIEHWHNIKDNLKFAKSVLDITKWKWLSVNKRSHDVILARLRSGCIQLNDHLHKINLNDLQSVIFVQMKERQLITSSLNDMNIVNKENY